MEKISILKLDKKTLEKLRNSAIIATIALILSGCSTKEEKLQKQIAEVQRLEYALKQQAENYRQVADQQNIQQDLKDEWADPTINQEIWYSLDRASAQDKKIAKTKKKLQKAQKKLAKMKEDINNVTSTDERLNTSKYDYIPQEFERSKSK